MPNKALGHWRGLGFLLVFFILLICSSTALAAPGQGDALVVQLRWLHQFQFAGYYAALENGYYRQAGLEVTLVEGGPGRNPIDEVLSGRAQYGAASNEVLLARMRGKPVKVLAVIFQQSPSILLARKISGINSPQDMLGQRVMMMPGMDDTELLAMFMKEGIKLEKIHRLPTSYNIDDLVKGKTDVFNAYLTNEPFYLEQRGMAASIIRPSTYGIHFYGDCLFTSEEEVKKNPERAKAFRQATLRGWQYAMDHPEEVIELILSKYSSRKTRDHLRFEAAAMRELLQPEMIQMGHMNPGRWRHMAETMSALGQVSKDFSLEGLTYDPDAEIDHAPILWAVGISLAVLLVVGTVAIYLFRLNRRLRKEVVERARAEQRFATMAANVPGVIVQLRAKQDGSRQYTYLSPRCRDFFGVGPEEVIKQGRLLNWHPEDRERINRTIAANRSTLISHNLVGRVILPDGQEKWINLTASPSREPNGDLLYDGFILDITQRKLAEMEYLASERKIKAMSQAVEDALVMVDSQGRVVFFNPAAEKLFGYSAAEAMGMVFHDMAAPPQYREKARQGVASFAQTGQGPILGTTTELEAIDRQGRVFPVEVTLSSFQVDDEWFAVGTVRDISARKQAEDELRASQARYRGLLDASPDPVTVYDLQGMVTYANPAFEQTFGWDHAELVGKRIDFVPSHEKERMQEGVARLMRGETVSLEGQRLTKDGRLLDMQIKAAGLSDAEGKLVGTIVNFRDISARKRAEEAIKESERRLGAIVDFLPDPALVIDAQGRVLSWNQAMERLTGLAKQDMIGKGDHEYALPFYGQRRPILIDLVGSWNEEVAGQYLSVRREGDCLVSESFHPHLSEGGIYLSGTATLLRDASGQVMGAIETLRDITARRRMEEALREREEYFRAVFDNAGVGIISTDADGRYQRVNQAFLEMLGYTWEELKSKDPAEVTHFDDRQATREAMQKMLAGELHVWRMEKRYLHKDGSLVWGEVVAVPIQEKDGRFTSILATITDITERKRAEALMVEKEVAERAAARAEEARHEAEEAREELQAKLMEIERFNRLALGREERILELKRQVNTLASLASFEQPFSVGVIESAQEVDADALSPERPSAEMMEIDSDRLAEILAGSQFTDLMNAFWNTVGIPAAIIDLEGRVLASSPWQRACTDFHRLNETTCARCIESDTQLALQLNEGQPFSMYRCNNGLTDCASPVIIGERHLANAFVGQFLTEPPDLDFFRRQAMECGIEVEPYLAAIADLPVVSADKLPAILSFLLGMAQTVVSMTVERLRAQHAEEITARRAEDILRERAAALSLAEDAELARREIEQYKGRLELLVAERTEELKLSEERSRLLLDSAGEGIFGMDAQGKLTFINPSALAMLGFAEAELLGRGMHEIIHHSRPDGSAYPVQECPMHASFSQGTTHEVVDEVLWRKDGRSFPVEYSSTPISKNGRVLGAVITFRNIAERQAAQQALARERALFLDILEKSPISIAITSRGILRFVNPIVKEKFGFSVGDPAPKVYVNEADRAMLIGLLQRDGIVKNREVQMWSIDRRKLDMLVTYLPITFDGEPGVLAWLVDITERKQAEVELRQYLEDLERFNRLTLGREERMIELKVEINDLLGKMGQGQKYKIVDQAQAQ